jgi:hypothetical protein
MDAWFGDVRALFTDHDAAAKDPASLSMHLSSSSTSSANSRSTP